MLKDIILGILLVGSIALGVKAPYWEAIECLGLERDVKEYNETITQLQRASHINTILNNNSNSVEILKYCLLAQAQIVHIVSDHAPYITKEGLDKLAQDYKGLSMAINLYGGNNN